MYVYSASLTVENKRSQSFVFVVVFMSKHALEASTNFVLVMVRFVTISEKEMFFYYIRCFILRLFQVFFHFFRLQPRVIVTMPQIIVTFSFFLE